MLHVNYIIYWTQRRGEKDDVKYLQTSRLMLFGANVVNITHPMTRHTYQCIKSYYGLSGRRLDAQCYNIVPVTVCIRMEIHTERTRSVVKMCFGRARIDSSSKRFTRRRPYRRFIENDATRNPLSSVMSV